ncbi:MAG: 4-hydroxy-tetrahydrodipicolinate synthase [Flavobacteriaceae bacterium]|uniref:4-hydroxy-tetrahydrodipicolinate synthase n=1 Tax=Bizionia echini TaxID=649333 RepID=UPI000C8D263C|nr:4-hydroxy-tetrahydrodipicolinate synthase [Flavobacteriaceae bacterium]|tara:strand:- start:781 stop:1662 length:882 start_codon:yes stop_codon:yes gene_type:complete
MKHKLTGAGIAIVTPFKADLSVDHEALTRIVNYNIENGMDYIVISGTTGESVTITTKEKQAIINTIITANNKRVPLVLGIGGNNTSQVIAEIQSTDFSGIDAILSVSPYYSKPTQEGIKAHFESISKVSPLPIILYNVPGRTGSNMLPETTLALANTCKNIVAVKEAAGNMAQYLRLLNDKPSDFLIISGDDDLALPVTLAGGSGVISVIGQAFPKDFAKMIQLGLDGNNKEAFKLHNKLMDITGLIFSENNPSGIKAVLEVMNLCKPIVRLPLVEATDKLKKNISEFVNNYA